MKESPVLTETPVGRPAAIRKDAFFFNKGTYDYLHGRTLLPEIPRQWGGIEWIIVLTALLFPLGLITFLFFPAASNPLSIIAIVIGFAVPLILDSYQRIQSGKRVIREGKFLVGTLEHLTASQHGSPHSDTLLLNITYYFETPLGKYMRRYTTKLVSGVSYRSLPNPNTPVYVLYFNDDEFHLL